MKNLIIPNYINKLAERIDSRQTLLQVVLGPRQVGNTTGILKLLEDRYQSRSIYVSADRVFNADSHWLRDPWLQAQSEGALLVVDEIQKSFNWAEAIKALYDT